jgi:hypothetical protein
MSQESISFFEDKTTEQIINWMIAHLSESQLRACLNSAGITPEYSTGQGPSRVVPSSSGAGPSSSGAGPSSSGAGSSSDPLPMMPQSMPQVPQFSPPPTIAPRQFPTFNVAPYEDPDISSRQINPLSTQDLESLIKYVGYQVESKEDITRAFPAVDAIGLGAIPVYIYGYSAPIVYFIGFVTGPTGMFVKAFQAPTLKIFKQIGFELLRILNENVISGIYKLNPGETVTKEMQRRAKAFALLNNKQGIMTNTLQILNPSYIKDVVRPYIATQKAAKFGITENYNDTGYIFDDLTVDDFDNLDNNFGENEDQDYEENYEEEENENENENENQDYDETETESIPVTKNMRVYDMNPEQLSQHMLNKFGSKFASDYTAEKYVNSNGVPAVKYIKSEKSENIENETNSEMNSEMNSEIGGPIINGFGEESDEEENLF